MNLLNIYLSFAKVGLFTFGGGYAMLPLIESDIIQKRGWLSMAEFTDIVGIAEGKEGAGNRVCRQHGRKHGFALPLRSANTRTPCRSCAIHEVAHASTD
jgi:hypothetical protein